LWDCLGRSLRQAVAHDEALTQEMLQ
jgi:hypothetical protein